MYLRGMHSFKAYNMHDELKYMGIANNKTNFFLSLISSFQHKTYIHVTLCRYTTHLSDFESKEAYTFVLFCSNQYTSTWQGYWDCLKIITWCLFF